MTDKELIEKLRIIFNEKYHLYYRMNDLTKHKSFKDAWGSLEIHEAIGLLTVIGTPQKEIKELSKNIAKEVSKYFEKNIAKEIKGLFSEDAFLYEEFLSYEECMCDCASKCCEVILEKYIDKLDINKIRERTKRWVNKKENKLLLEKLSNAAKVSKDNELKELKKQQKAIQKRIREFEQVW